MKENNQLDRIENLLTNYIEYSTERFSNLEEKVDDLARNQRSTKLELLDKLASKEKVDDHELRIQKLESQLV